MLASRKLCRLLRRRALTQNRTRNQYLMKVTTKLNLLRFSPKRCNLASPCEYGENNKFPHVSPTEVIERESTIDATEEDEREDVLIDELASERMPPKWVCDVFGHCHI